MRATTKWAGVGVPVEDPPPSMPPLDPERPWGPDGDPAPQPPGPDLPEPDVENPPAFAAAGVAPDAARHTTH